MYEALNHDPPCITLLGVLTLLKTVWCQPMSVLGSDFLVSPFQTKVTVFEDSPAVVQTAYRKSIM